MPSASSQAGQYLSTEYLENDPDGGPRLLATDEPAGDPQPLRRPRERQQRRARKAVLLSRRNAVVAAAGVAGAGSAGGLLLTRGDAPAGASVRAAVRAAGSGSSPAGTGSSAAKAKAAKAKPAARKAAVALPKNLDPGLLISRATYGPTAAVRASVDDLGPTAWLKRQLAPSKLADPRGAAVRKQYPRLAWSTATTRKRIDNGGWEVMFDLVAAHLGRAMVSECQLCEVMVDFWSNHLNVTCPSSDVWDTRHRYDADVIRKHALGTFENMLLASAFHPSMLLYLNNAESTGRDPNENYARELMELHTVGLRYKESDVKRAALLLTGNTVQDGKAGYDPSRHYVGRVKVLGFSHANASAAKGRTAQRAFLRYLARHPATAKTIATKLCLRFVSDTPPPALVKRLGAVYRKKGTAIAPVLMALFASPEFAASRGDKVRRPFERMVATTRALGVRPGNDPKGLMDLYWMLQASGHQPLGWHPPNGYPDVAAAWQSPAAALDQFNATSTLAHGWWPTKLMLPGPKKLLTKPPTTRSGVITAVARKVLGRKPTTGERAAANTMLKGTKLPTSFRAGSWEQQETVALTATLLLNSPAHLVR